MTERNIRVAELIKDTAAVFLNRESNRLSLITVIRATISKDFKNATVFFTVYPQEKEEEALHFAKRKRSDFKTYLKSHLHLKRIPFVDFEIDAGEKHRQKIDEISRDIEE